jgi:hypothetical protein
LAWWPTLLSDTEGDPSEAELCHTGTSGYISGCFWEEVGHPSPHSAGMSHRIGRLGTGWDMSRWQPLSESLDPDVRLLVEQLRRLKLRTGLSLVELAESTPYSKSAWHRYLNGTKFPTAGRRGARNTCGCGRRGRSRRRHPPRPPAAAPAGAPGPDRGGVAGPAERWAAPAWAGGSCSRGLRSTRRSARPAARWWKRRGTPTTCGPAAPPAWRPHSARSRPQPSSAVLNWCRGVRFSPPRVVRLRRTARSRPDQRIHRGRTAPGHRPRVSVGRLCARRGGWRVADQDQDRRRRCTRPIERNSLTRRRS